MAKLVSRPYEEEETASVPHVESDAQPAIVNIVGILLIVLLCLGGLYMVYSAFASI